MGNIVWLASYPKSGNTWVRAFIQNLIVDGDKPSSLQDITRFFESEAKPDWYRGHFDRDLAEVKADDLFALRPKVHAAIAQTVNRGSVFTKTHNQLTHYQETPLHALELTAAAVYIVRNPLDVTVSAADHFGLSIDETIEFMQNPNTATNTDDESVASFLGSWSQHVESWTRSPHPQFLVLRYEDMLDKSMHSFTQIARLLGLEKDKPRIKKAIKFSSFKELRSQELKAGFSERSDKSKSFFRRGKKFQWLDVLSENQAAAIIEQHRDQMMRYDYVPPKFR